jgi:hypothetical protein
MDDNKNKEIIKDKEFLETINEWKENSSIELREWENEPDRVEFTFMGYKCLIIRNNFLGHLCGYVALTNEDKYFGIDYLEMNISVHGGLTFSKYGMKEEDNDLYYYKPLYDEQGNMLYWIGFDCCHFMDYAPKMAEDLQKLHADDRLTLFNHTVYRNIEYVKAQIESMCMQLTYLK